MTKNLEIHSCKRCLSSAARDALVGVVAFALIVGASCARKPVETVSASQGATTSSSSGAAAPSPATATNGFGPTVPNTAPAPRHAPTGMVWIPGGEFSMGAADSPSEGEVGMQAARDSRPIHRVYVDGFFMDQTDVTNVEFAKFVKATGYLTVAERKPRQEDFPNAPPENLVTGSVVFSPPDHPVSLDNHFQWWSYVHGANWRHPTGPKSSIVGKGNYPVVQIAYEDAKAYARWAGKRLPTEAQWEFFARGGLAGKPYVWGDDFRPNGKWDPDEPRERKKTHRGGSFLCTDQYCLRYVVGTRGKGEVSTGTNHLGFRCVEDATTLGNGVSASHM